MRFIDITNDSERRTLATVTQTLDLWRDGNLMPPVGFCSTVELAIIT